MRLTWWHDALERLADAPPPADPLLQALRAAPGVEGQALLPLIDGWEALLDDLPLADEAVRLHARARGGTLFEQAAALLDPGAPLPAEAIRAAGEAWALADLAHRTRDAETAARARAAAPAMLPRAWPKSLRPLGLLATFARADLRLPAGRPRRQGAPARVLRALAFGLTGR